MSDAFEAASPHHQQRWCICQGLCNPLRCGRCHWGERLEVCRHRLDEGIYLASEPLDGTITDSSGEALQVLALAHSHQLFHLYPPLVGAVAAKCADVMLVVYVCWSLFPGKTDLVPVEPIQRHVVVPECSLPVADKVARFVSDPWSISRAALDLPHGEVLLYRTSETPDPVAFQFYDLTARRPKYNDNMLQASIMSRLSFPKQEGRFPEHF